MEQKRKFKHLSGFLKGASDEVVQELLEFTGALSTSMAGDPYRTSFNEGKRSMGLMLLNLMRDESTVKSDKVLAEGARRRFKHLRKRYVNGQLG